ncbi:MAG: hypothetical protein JNK87_42740 [Bryobacterales bacterium]|nr:hypothetical protein [Bryobacterales bacterium]
MDVAHVGLGWRTVQELPGWRAAWPDALCWGPVPEGMDVAELRAFREEFWRRECEAWDAPVSEANRAKGAAMLAQRKNYLADWTEARRFAEVVLWFGPGMGDQLGLLQALGYLGGLPLRLSMAEPDRGFAKRRAVRDEEIAAARELWRLFRAASRAGFHEGAERQTVFPAMAGAAAGIRELSPDYRNGVDRVQWQLLQAAIGGKTVLQVVAAALYGEVGDTCFFATLWRMMHGPVPLVRCADGSAAPRRPAWDKKKVELTAAGRAVMEGGWAPPLA